MMLAAAHAARSVTNCHHGVKKPGGGSGWHPRGTATSMLRGAAPSAPPAVDPQRGRPARVARRGTAAASEAALQRGRTLGGRRMADAWAQRYDDPVARHALPRGDRRHRSRRAGPCTAVCRTRVRDDGRSRDLWTETPTSDTRQIKPSNRLRATLLGDCLDLLEPCLASGESLGELLDLARVLGCLRCLEL